MPRPWVALRLGTLDQKNLKFSRCTKDQCNSRLRMTGPRLGLLPVLWVAREPINEFAQPSVWDFHSNAPGVRPPNVFVELRLESDRESVLENPAGQIEEIAGVPNG